MTFSWINAVNATAVFVLVICSVIGQKKSGLPSMQSRSTFLNIMEQIGRYASMLLMVLPLLPGLEFGFASVGVMTLWLLLTAILLLIYALLWTRVKSRGAVLYALAIVPVLLFLQNGILLRHWALLGAAVLFGICHVWITRAFCLTQGEDT